MPELQPQINQINLQNQPKLTVDDDWKRWIAVNKLLNNDEWGMIRALIQNGFDVQIAFEEIRNAVAHPYFQAGSNFVQLLQKLESLLGMYEKLSELSPKPRIIERKSCLSREDFLENYYAKNIPVIFTDIMHNWQALDLWNPEYLKQNYGEFEVEIQANRNKNQNYELEVEKHSITLLLKDYIEKIVSNGMSNDYYMVANNNTLEREGMKGLLDDIEIFPEYLDASDTKGKMFFWFGPGGTVTPLHHDTSNIFLAQVLGSKKIRMISPNQTPLLYNYVGVFSKVDCENPDYENYPLFRNVNIIETVLEPGEVLFIPVGWWHHVRSLDISISVSFTNFIFPNQYDWKSPNVSF